MMSHIVETLLEGLREEAQIDPFVQNLLGQLRQLVAEPTEGDAALVIVEAIKAMSADRARLSVMAGEGVNARRSLEKIAPLLKGAASAAVLSGPEQEPRALALDWVPFEDAEGAFALVGFTRLIAGPKGAWAIVGQESGRVEGGGLLDAQLAAEAAAKKALGADLGMLRLIGGAWWRTGSLGAQGAEVAPKRVERWFLVRAPLGGQPTVHGIEVTLQRRLPDRALYRIVGPGTVPEGDRLHGCEVYLLDGLGCSFTVTNLAQDVYCRLGPSEHAVRSTLRDALLALHELALVAADSMGGHRADSMWPRR